MTTCNATQKKDLFFFVLRWKETTTTIKPYNLTMKTTHIDQATDNIDPTY